MNRMNGRGRSLVAAVVALLTVGLGACGDKANANYCGDPTIKTQSFLVDGGTVFLCCPPSYTESSCQCVEPVDGGCPASDAG